MPANFDRAKREAERLIERYGYTKPPIDPEAIAEAESVRVLYATFNGEIGDKLSGYSDAASASIVINKDIAPNRKIFTIAHELGHHLLHRDYLADDGSYQVFPRFNEYGAVKPPEEQEADAFAASLLVPIKMLKRYKDVASVSELASMFCVSEAVILNRLKWA